MADSKPGSGGAAENATTAEAPSQEPTQGAADNPEAAATETKAEEAAKTPEPESEEAKKDNGVKGDKEAPAAATPDDETTPLQKLGARLPAVLEKAGWHEMWNVKLLDGDDVPTSIVLQKFLNANNGDVDAAEKQLVAALEWRKKVNPNELVGKAFDKPKFGGLGYVTTHKKGQQRLVITWNIYGKVKDVKATFGDVEE
jgi:phosphatidylinositol transfer protein SFH5